MAGLLAQQFFRLLALRHVAEAPDAAAGLAVPHERARESLEHPAILEGEHVEVFASGAIELPHLRDERIRVRELTDDRRHQLVIVAALRDLLRDAPHLEKARVRVRDAPIAIDDQNAVGRRLDRRAE